MDQAPKQGASKLGRGFDWEIDKRKEEKKKLFVTRQRIEWMGNSPLTVVNLNRGFHRKFLVPKTAGSIGQSRGI